MQRHEEETRANALAAEVRALQHKLQENKTDNAADLQSHDSIAAVHASSGAAGAALRRLGSTVSVRRRIRASQEEVADLSQYFDEFAQLKRTISEKDRELDDLKRSKHSAQDQFELLSREHNATLNRMEALSAALSSSMPDPSATHRSGPRVAAELANAQRKVEDLQAEVKGLEGQLADLQEVCVCSLPNINGSSAACST